MTNLATLYTFVIAQPSRPSFDQLAADFQIRLSFALLDAQPPAEFSPDTIIPVRGNFPSVTGSMNDMLYCMRPIPEKNWPDSGHDDEAMVNRTPFSAIGMDSPKERFFRALNAS